MNEFDLQDTHSDYFQEPRWWFPVALGLTIALFAVAVFFIGMEFAQ